MRSPLPLLLLVAALGGGAWLLLGGDASDGPDRLDSWKIDEGAHGARGGAATPSGALTADALPVIGVLGEGPPIPARAGEFAEVMSSMVRFPEEGGRLTGALVLDRIAAAVGKSMPIRFNSRSALKRFQTAELPMPAPKEADLAQVLDWMREIGFQWQEREGYLMILPLRGP